MTTTTPTVADEVERYLRTGDTDPYHAAWSAPSFLAGAQRAGADLENALVAEVSRRATRVYRLAEAGSHGRKDAAMPARDRPEESP